MTSLEKIALYRKLLDIEQEEDRKMYQESVSKRSLKEQCERGVSWYPLAIKRMYIGTGERIMMEVEKTNYLDKNHVFQAGSLVSVFAIDKEKPTGFQGGVVYSIKGNEMKIVLNTDDFPSQLIGVKMGVTLDFDDKTYKEMVSALTLLGDAKPKSKVEELREIIWGNKMPTRSQWHTTYENPKLNASQCRAVQNCLEAHEVAIIHGPPGTGKTTTLVEVIREAVLRETQVLVCAPSNTAVDLLSLKCELAGMQVLRLGNPARVDEELQNITLDARISQHPDYSALRKIRKEAENVRNRALKFKRNFDDDARHERRELLQEAKELQAHARHLEDYILNQVLNQAQVITATLAGANHSTISKKHFHTVFIDEAAQALAPACWIPILKANKVIFAGDHHQLPPTVKSMDAGKGGLANTLFEELMKEKPQTAVMLETQYRMHQHIMAFSGKTFYENNLTAAETVKDRKLHPEICAIEFVDTAGCSFEEKFNPETLSTSNPEEAHLLLRHLAITLNDIEQKDPYLLQPEFSIGVLSPYKEQVQLLREQLPKVPMLQRFLSNISINTVDGFQGQERDMMYISLVRSNSSNEIGFLKDTRRMNVALTRARKKLVVIGDSATIGNYPFYQKWLDYVESIGAYKSAWEFLYD